VLMIGFGGAIGGWLLTFLLPSACRVKLWFEKGEPWLTWRAFRHYCFIVFGMAAAAVCGHFSILGVIESLSQQNTDK
jgi:hypothetical protein